MNDLRPNATIQKALISTTSRFVGEFEHEELVIAHAWPDYSRFPSQVSLTENPLCRNAFVIVLRTEPIEAKPGVPVPNYGPNADMLCAFLSVLYGKRFDSHGLLEGTGLFRRPDMSLEFSLCTPTLPQNSHSPRKDLEIPLNLSEFRRIAPLLLEDNVERRLLQTTTTACQFYQQALQNFECHPETAYLNLITCGEIISGFYEYQNEELLDDNAKDILRQIKDGLENGEKVARQVTARLKQVKRRFVTTITRLVNDYFFERSESKDALGSLKKDDFAQRVGAAYDLRSKYVHTGIPFGGWVSMLRHEIQVGRPVVQDNDYGKVLARAPTYLGLERVMRFCLLRFIHLNGIQIDPHLS